MPSWIEKLLTSSQGIQERILRYLDGTLKEEPAFIEELIDELTKKERTIQQERTQASSQHSSYEDSSESWFLSEHISHFDEDTDYDLAYQKMQNKDGVNRYTRGSFIAKGGFSQVWRIHDHYLNRTIVSKIATDLSAESKVQFIREAQICAQLQHNGVIPLHDVIEKDNGEIHILMRQIHGNSLQEVINTLPHHQKTQGGSEIVNRAIHQVLIQFIQVCNTIAYAHARGVVHLDLKPQNIMIGFFGETFVIDWGISRPIEAVGSSPSQYTPIYFDPELEQNLNLGVIGTPSFMSPEQIQDQGIDHRSDVYSLGCILIRILFQNKNTLSGIKIIQERANESFTLIPEESTQAYRSSQQIIYNFEHLVKICRKATQFHPHDRHCSVLELIQDLELWVNGEQRRSKATQHVQEITSCSEKIYGLEREIEKAYSEQNVDFAERFQHIQSLKIQKDRLSFTLRQEYQKAIFYLVEDTQKIESFISSELHTYWQFIRSKDWKVAQRIFIQLELYIDLLPSDLQHQWKEKISLLAGMEDLQLRGALVPRLEQLALFQKLMQEHQSVLIVGPAGIGKTHFAKENCSKMVFEGKRHCFVNIQNCIDIMDVSLHIQKELSIESDTVLSILEIAAHINEHGIDVFIFDNCEQLNDGAEEGLQLLLETLSNTRVILTSRKKHSLRDVKRYALSSMTPLESVELFVELLSRRVQTLELEDIQEIFRLVELVEFHPLSIELIAQRARKIPISELRSYLNEKFSLLRGNISDGRYGSLWETLNWSWNLLSPTAQVLLTELIEFTGTFFQIDLLNIHPSLRRLDILHALTELEELHFITEEKLLQQPAYFVAQSIKDFIVQKRETKDNDTFVEFQKRFLNYYSSLFDAIEDWNEREARAQQMIQILGQENIERHIRQQCLLNIYTLNQRFGPYNRGFEWLYLLYEGDENIRLRLFSRVFFLGQRLDNPHSFHQNIFHHVDLLQEAKKEIPFEWFQFQKMKFRYTHLYGTESHETITRMIFRLQEDLDTIFKKFDPKELQKIKAEFAFSLVLYKKDTLNLYSTSCLALQQYQPMNKQEEYVRHSQLASVYTSLGRFVDSLREYDLSHQCAQALKNKNQICAYYRNKGLTYYIMRHFDKATAFFQKSLEIAEELNSQESIAFSKNLLGVLDFEQNGTVPKFTLQRAVPLIKNYILIHATVQDIEKIFLAYDFIQEHNITPSVTLSRIFLSTYAHVLMDFGLSFDSSVVLPLLYKFSFHPQEDPIGFSKETLTICPILYCKGDYNKALHMVNKALEQDMGESKENIFFLHAERAYIQHHLGQDIDVSRCTAPPYVICSSNQKETITAVLNICVAISQIQCEQKQACIDWLQRLRDRYPITHVHQQRIQELTSNAQYAVLSDIQATLYLPEVTSEMIIDKMKNVIRIYE